MNGDSRRANASEPDIRTELLARYGELLSGQVLQRCLGFRSLRSFQRALSEERLPVPTFTLEGRRGTYARTRDVAAWLASLGHGAGPHSIV